MEGSIDSKTYQSITIELSRNLGFTSVISLVIGFICEMTFLSQIDAEINYLIP